MNRVVLAFSGGLDTTICLHWLRAVKGYRVICFSAQLGQFESFEELGEKAIEVGAVAAQIEDLRERFVTEYIFPSIRASAVYEEGYLLGGALSRALISEELVRLAREENCNVIAHGCRGVGNDAIRFERHLQQLAPDLRIVAPLAQLRLKTPKADIEYARRHGIRFDAPKRTLFNIDQNLWGSNIQLGFVQDTGRQPPQGTYVLTSPPEEAPDRPEDITIEFEAGLPRGLDDAKVASVAIMEVLNQLGGKHAIGRFDVIENRISGIKSRELYEAPAAWIIYRAHRALEELVLNREMLHFQKLLSQKYAELVYEGLWFNEFRRALDAFFERGQHRVTGSVQVRLYKGSVHILGRRSPFSLFRSELLRYDRDESVSRYLQIEPRSSESTPPAPPSTAPQPSESPEARSD